ncbi:MAG: hypothetical protein EAX86_01560 [Candidatus Heimdallarchaeota archaeon]|nr:hypothetical protein [Candidatus Heimdallarchaeota archaeon]
MALKTNSGLFLWFMLSLSLFVILYSPLQLSYALEVTPNTVVELQDVVVVNYTLWVNNVRQDDQEGTVYVNDPSEPVPGKIVEEFPDIKVPPNIGFMEALVGMKAEDEDNVVVPPEKGFTNTTDVFYGEELFYQIRLLEILKDASNPPFTIFDLPFFMPLLILVLFIIGVIIFFRVQRFRSTYDILGLKTKCYVCDKLAEVRCGNLGCNTPYCRDCFNIKGCEVCASNKMVPIKK